MNKISFIITNFNTKKYTKFVYNSIRKNLGYIHEIVMLDDGSSDGTWDLLQELEKVDINMIIHRNEINIGIAYSYNKMVELASNEIICMLHPDMYVPPKFDEIMLKHMEEYDFITPLRVEPNVGYPESVDKVLIDFGTKSEEFDEGRFIKWHEKNIEENNKNGVRIEQRMFFPWMMKKSIYEEIGGNDVLFCKYMVDDDDFYLRLKMAGVKYCQLFETAVYHMPSKSVRKREDTSIISESDFNKQYQKSIRNFVRKWGSWPGHVWDENRDMIIPKKYDIGFVVENCHSDYLEELEPWCSNIYVSSKSLISQYIKEEQELTLFDLKTRVVLNDKKNIVNNIIIEFDISKIDEESLFFIQNIQKIIENSGQLGSSKFGIFTVYINSLDTYEKDHIKCDQTIITIK